jgi:hypothetical protein
VGATGEDSAAIGVDGDKLSNAAADSGAVYIFARTGQAWSEQTYIKAWNTGATDMFGFSVALSDNGTTLAVAAPQEDSAQAGVQNGNAYVENGNVPEAGAAYIYVYATGSWTSQAYIKPEFVGFGGDYFAHPLSLSGDGNVLACGAPGEDTVAANSGAVWMFRRTGTTWGQEGQLKASNAGDNDQFGATVAVSTSGSVMIGAPYEDSDATGLAGNQNDDSSADSGAVYAFGHTTSGWMQTTYGKASANDAGDQFGFTVAMSQDGTTRAATASFEDSTARGVDGDPLDNGAPDSGCAAVSFY